MRRFGKGAWLRPFLQRYRKSLLAAVGLGVAAMAFSIGLMFVSGYLLSGTAEHPDWIFQLVVPLAFVQIFGIVRPFLSYLGRLAAHDWVLRVTSELRGRLFASLASDNVAARLGRATGDALGLMADDVAHIQDLFVRCALPVAAGLLCWLAAVVALGCFSVTFALFMLLLVGLVAIVAPLVTMLVDAARTMRAKELRDRLYADATDDVLGIADWVCSGRRDEFLDRIERSAVRAHAHSSKSRAFARWRDLIAQVVVGAAVLAVTAWAASRFGAASVGAQAMGGLQEGGLWHPGMRDLIAAFVIAVFPLMDALLPMSDAAGGAPAHLDAVGRLGILDERDDGGLAWADASDGAGLVGLLGIEGSAIAPARRPSGPAATDGPAAGRRRAAYGPPAEDGRPPRPDLELRAVTYSYGPDQAPAVKKLDLVVPHGQKLAILGPSGSGKSTLLGLVRGDLAPSSGTVALGGTAVAALGAGRTEFVGSIEQDPYVFDATLLDNVRLGKPEATEQEALRALESVGLGRLVSGLPQGLLSRVGEGGVLLSGGQRHRLALARILLADQPVVLLDEPMASLDPATEAALLRTLLDVLDGRTVIMVTHHLLGIERFDRVLFFEHGGVARDAGVPLDGTPAALERASARYRRLLAFDRGLGDQAAR